jgi:hypothetical protein
MTRKERLTQRNERVREAFYKVKEKNPKWRLDAVIEEVANIFFLSPRTVDAIISHEGTYKDNTVITLTPQLSIF